MNSEKNDNKIILGWMRTIYGDTPQQLATEDIISLVTLLKRVEEPNPMVVEIGSWKGFSTGFLAYTIKGKGNIFAVDNWQGNPTTLLYNEAQEIDIYSVFRFNMERLGLWDCIHPIVMDSLMAARIFADGILDFIFIDADHRYKFIKQDIEIWFPKLKVGGILCGHDAEFYYSKLSKMEQKNVNDNLDIDYIRLGADIEIGIHPGVVRALYDCFEDKHLLMPRKIWHYIKRGQNENSNISIKRTSKLT